MSKKRIIERYFLRQKYSRGKLMMLIKRKSKDDRTSRPNNSLDERLE